MGGVTLAHHLQTDTYSANDTATNEIMTAQSWPVDDLTDEVQDLMLKEWLQPWSAVTSDPDLNCLDQDSQLYAQAIQLEDLFGQADLTFDQDHAPFYDQITYAPSNITDESLEQTTCSPLQMVENLSHGQLDTLVKPSESPLNAMLRRRRSSSSSEECEDPEDDDEDTDSDDDLSTLSSTTRKKSRYERRRSDSSSEDSDSEDDSEMMPGASSQYMFVHKRQLEEMLLAKITNELEADRLPGILAIVSSTDSSHNSDEVEIDLSCLARDQLVRILGYVEACILEQSGGPAVNIYDFKQENGSHVNSSPSPLAQIETQSKQRKRSKRSHDDTPKATPTAKKRRAHVDKRKRRKNRKRDDDDLLVSSSVVVHRDPDSIASSRPKRRAAERRRRLLDEAIRGSDQEDADEEADDVLVVFSDEQMDLAVVDNETIVHQPSAISSPVAAANLSSEEETFSDNDEEIDIML